MLPRLFSCSSWYFPCSRAFFSIFSIFMIASARVGALRGGGPVCFRSFQRLNLRSARYLRNSRALFSLRRFHSRRDTEDGVSPSSEGQKKRLVFLGTPSVAANSLKLLHEAAKNNSEAPFEIIRVVTQPPSPSGRKKKLLPSAVQLMGEDLKIPILCPVSAKDPEFLDTLETLNIDLCITAAYGNFLPKRFLSTPKFGTINIHPSLLPKYRGAAPVQRSLENGETESGVTVLFTVLKMDAGPIIQQVKYPIDENAKATEVLEKGFKIGTEALLKSLPSIFDGSVQSKTVQQNDEDASSADKISSSEAQIDFATMNARAVHNRCRAFAEWPGIHADFLLGSDASEPQRVKIATTVVISDQKDETLSVNSNCEDPTGNRVMSDLVEMVKYPLAMSNGKMTEILCVTCGDGSKLGIVELQPPSKKVIDAKSFWNGLRGDTVLRWVPADPKIIENAPP